MKNENPNALRRRYALQLILIAASTLYLELAIIRFSAAEIISLGFFSNFVLISVFVGLSLGFLSVDSKIDFKKYFPITFSILFIFILVSRIDASALQDQKTLFFFGEEAPNKGVLPEYFLLPLLFMITAFLFAILGQQTGRMFKYFTPLKAYTLDITGSLAGIILFSWQSYLWSTPVTWVVTSSFLIILFHLFGRSAVDRKQTFLVCVGGFCVLVFLWFVQSPYKTIWSFYQKIQFANDGLMKFPYTNSFSRIYVNGIPHQFLSAAIQANNAHYGIPYRFFDGREQDLNDVLIIGAGSGTDISVALMNRAKSVDAVEIDFGIVSFGKEFHPDNPYEDDRVHLYIKDGREFLRNGSKKYDLIIFALPDSLLRFSPMSSVRLESYLFTLESFRNVRNRLKPKGLFVLYNMYRWAWLKDRLSSMVVSVFGSKPLQVEYGLYTVFAIQNIPPKTPTEKLSKSPFHLPVDDWPYFYLKRPGIPWLYIAMLLMFLAVALFGIWILTPKGTLRQPQWPFFFMGVSFLLLETKSISMFALLFGTTWMVNSLAFAGVLISILLSNWFVYIFKIKNRKILFGLLFGALTVAFFYHPANFLEFSNPVVRYILVIGLIFSPIFFANLLFSREFRDTEVGTKAFGWNVFGAVVGGGLEYCSLLIGNRNLILIVAFIYFLAGIMMKKSNQT